MINQNCQYCIISTVFHSSACDCELDTETEIIEVLWFMVKDENYTSAILLLIPDADSIHIYKSIWAPHLIKHMMEVSWCWSCRSKSYCPYYIERPLPLLLLKWAHLKSDPGWVKTCLFCKNIIEMHQLY